MDTVIGHGRFKDGKLALPSEKESYLGISSKNKTSNVDNQNIESNSSDTVMLILKYILYILAIVGIVIVFLLMSISSGKKSRTKFPSPPKRGLSSNHYTKTRQRRAMYARKGGSR